MRGRKSVSPKQILQSRVQQTTKQQTQIQQTQIEAAKISTVVSVMRTFAEQTNATGLEGLRNDFFKLQARGPHPSNCTFNYQKLNRTKCRYTDIMCLDHSRVVLKPWPDTQGDFIHANWISNEYLDNKFICTQGPLNQTCADFWRMVWQENVELIIMLCRTFEQNRPKCAQYWPLNPGQSLTFCGITIRTVEKRTADPDVHCTALLLTYRGERRTLAHYQWVSWPDKFVPNKLTVPYTLLSSARARKTPSIIHCSAGIGRTGTLVALEMVAKTLLSCRLPVVPDIIWLLRSQRSRVVQNEEQYLYVHYLTLQRLVNKGIVPDQIVSKFCRSYEQYYYSRTHALQIPLPIFKKKTMRLRRMGEVSSQKTQGSPTSVLKSKDAVISLTPANHDATPIKAQLSPSAILKRQDALISLVPPVQSDTRKAQQARVKSVTKKKAQTEKTAVEEATPANASIDIDKMLAEKPENLQTATAMPAKVTQSQGDIQSQYREAQQALLESFRRSQLDLLKNDEQTQNQPDAGKSVPADANAIETTQMENIGATVRAKAANATVAPAASTARERIRGRKLIVKGEDEPPRSVYAYLSNEVRKIKRMEENQNPKNGELPDEIDYVFMQPIYAQSYKAQQTDSTPSVVEKYVMNMLPEQYFNREMDDGPAYVKGVPDIKPKDGKKELETCRSKKK